MDKVIDNLDGRLNETTLRGLLRLPTVTSYYKNIIILVENERCHLE